MFSMPKIKIGQLLVHGWIEQILRKEKVQHVIMWHTHTGRHLEFRVEIDVMK